MIALLEKGKNLLPRDVHDGEGCIFFFKTLRCVRNAPGASFKQGGFGANVGLNRYFHFL